MQRSPGPLFGGVHEPLCLVLRFKCQDLRSVLHQKLHIQLEVVLKSIKSSRTGSDQRAEQLAKPTGHARSGVSAALKEQDVRRELVEAQVNMLSSRTSDPPSQRITIREAEETNSMGGTHADRVSTKPMTET